MKLINTTKNKTLVPELECAETFTARLRGLLGRSSLGSTSGLWIHRCPSIHTFFMQFTIDVVFLDKKMIVRALYANVQPWRLIWPVFGAESVVELTAGAIQNLNIELGDQLYVTH